MDGWNGWNDWNGTFVVWYWGTVILSTGCCWNIQFELLTLSHPFIQWLQFEQCVADDVPIDDGDARWGSVWNIFEEQCQTTQQECHWNDF